MTPAEWAILLAVAGLVLLVAELYLPTYGVLGVIGAASLLGAVGFCFVIERYLGVAALLGGLLAAPFVTAAMLKLWPRTSMARKMTLPPVDSRPAPLPFQMGQVGVAVSELRPMGECEFDGRRVEALSESGGIVPAGSRVKVMGADRRRPLVRVI
jgi:membrane-bound ClpP family serine protease